MAGLGWFNGQRSTDKATIDGSAPPPPPLKPLYLDERVAENPVLESVSVTDIEGKPFSEEP